MIYFRSRNQLKPMAENYVKFGESKLRNNCPKCFAQDGLKFSFYNKIEDTKLYTRATKEVKGELNCSHCESQIYPALWTDEIDRIYLYNIKRVGNPQTYQRFKPLAIYILVGIVLAGAAAAFGIYYLQTR